MATYGRWEVHPAAERFPLMDGKEFDELVASIKQNTQRNAVTVWEGQLIDGRNRVRACEILGVRVKAVEWDGLGSLTQFIVDQNINRRNLSRHELALIGLQLREDFAIEAKQRQREGGNRGIEGGRGNIKNPSGLKTVRVYDGVSGEALELAAKAVGVSASHLKRVDRLAKERPDLLSRVSDGELSANAADQIRASDAGCPPKARHRARATSTPWGRGNRAVDPHKALARAIEGIEGYLGLLEQFIGQFTEFDHESLKPVIARLRKLTTQRSLKNVSEN